MNPNSLVGVVFHWLGGLAAGSFYVPYRGVKHWSWETYWLVGGFFSWIIAPWALAVALTRDLVGVLARAPHGALVWAWFFGVLWGLGGLTFGLTMRYLVVSALIAPTWSELPSGLPRREESPFLTAPDKRSITIYEKSIRQECEPASRGFWQWGDEILADFAVEYGNCRFEDIQARSLNGGSSWKSDRAAPFPDLVTENTPASSETPVWSNGHVQTTEPLFFVKKNPQTGPTATLLFTPGKLLSLRTANGSATYSPQDFAVKGRTVEYVGNQPFPAVNEDDLVSVEKTIHSIANSKDGKRFLLFSEGHYFHDRQVVVDYTTEEHWGGPVPSKQTLPGLERMIEGKLAITIALLGDSISTGASASAVVRAFPYQPPFIDLFAARLKKITGNRVDVANFSVGGKTSTWGLTQIDRVIASKPDVIVIAFGMNDASGRMNYGKFKENIQATMDAARRALPQIEFILVSGMSANPEWSKAGVEWHAEYHRALLDLTGSGVVVCDVGSIWDYVAERKGFLSMTGNGVNHPNDFGHRLYADCLSVTVLGNVDTGH